MKNVVIYGRSNPNENIDIQVDELVEYAKNNNMKITKMYLDEEYLPFDYCRPYLKMLQHDADLKLLDTVLFTEFNVFGKDVSKALYYLNYFKSKNIRLIGIKDNYDNKDLDDSYYIFNEVVEAVYGKKSIS